MLLKAFTRHNPELGITKTNSRLENSAEGEFSSLLTTRGNSEIRSSRKDVPAGGDSATEKFPGVSPVTLWPSPGRWGLIFVSGILGVVCQLLFWRRVVPPGNRRARGEWQPARGRNSINIEQRAAHHGFDEFFDQTIIRQDYNGCRHLLTPASAPPSRIVAADLAEDPYRNRR